MRTSRQLISMALLGGLAVVGSAGAQTQQQQTSDGSDYRPMQLNSPERPEVKRAAIEAARSHGGAGSESTGGSTAPAPTSAATNSDEVRQGAMNAARSHGGAGSESTGSSTAPRPPARPGS
ncbi:hypothetical protein ACIPRI_16960 [Variovorax sp. LARHSF232]